MPTSPSLSDEVTFISGVTPDGKVANTSFQAWNGDDPATYASNTGSGKWGSGTAGTTGGTVKFYFDTASNWTETEKTVFRDALALYSAVANISFTEVVIDPTTNGNRGIKITRGNDGSAETNYFFDGPAGAGTAGGSVLGSMTKAVVSIDTSGSGFGPIDGNFATTGGYAWSTVIHELGHAVGIGHGGPYNAGSGIAPATHQYSSYDTLESSIMSYISPKNTAATYYGQYPLAQVNWGSSTDATGTWSRVPVTLMPLDILALQRLYGVSQSTLLDGNDVFGFHTNISSTLPFYDFTINTRPVVTLFDLGTGNTLDVSGFTAGSIINLNPGTYSSTNNLIGNIAIAYNTAIDTLITGSGADNITGNNDGDSISSGAGDDIIVGGTGNDQINAGDGNDTITPGLGNNTVDGGAGTDTVKYAQNRSVYTLSETSGTVYVVGGGVSDVLTNAEYLVFADQTVPASAIVNQVIGTSGDDTLFATSADDYIDGGAGINTLSYVNATANVSINLDLSGPQNTSGSGYDTIVSIQKLVGSNFGDFLTGKSSQSNNLSGGNGDDTLVGGQSDDVLDGGSGTDIASFVGTNGTRTYNLKTGTASGAGIGNDTLIGIEGINDGSPYGTAIVTGSDGDDRISITGANVTGSQISAGAGDDTVYDGGSASTLDGGAGTNALTLSRSGISPLNMLFEPGVAGTLSDGTSYQNFQLLNLYSGASNDELIFINPQVRPAPGGGVISNSWDGGGGTDTLTIVFSNYTTGLTLQINAATGDIPATARFDTISGNAQQTLMTTTSVENFRVRGGSGADRFVAGAGNDTLEGGAGDDYLDGGAGFDYAVYTSASAGVTVNLSITTAQGTGGAGSDQLVNIEGLIGSAFNDTLTGDGGDNLLQGGAGNDVLDGGAGTDTAIFSGARSAYSLAANSQSTTITGPDGTDTLTNIENLQFFDGKFSLATLLRSHAQSDFNGDGESDILWHSSANAYSEWLMNGATPLSKNSLGTVALWSVVGQGDFNGDGKSEILWHHANGSIEIDGIGTSGWANMGNPGILDSTWSAVAVGDFNGDGKADILWRSGTAYSEWLMNGGTVSSKLDMAASATWSVVGAGDFNGDGKAEVLWHNASGATEIDAISISGWASLGNPGNIDSSWSVDAIGDFNGDGNADILWRSSANAYSEWLMNGATVTSKVDLGTVNSWSVVGSGDYNGDGKTEILWHHISGALEIDAISASGWANQGTPGSLDNSWTVAGTRRVVADFNGDGESDIVWHNGTGYAAWTMDGARSSNRVGMGAGAAWSVMGAGDFDGDGKSEILWHHTNGTIEIDGVGPSGWTTLGNPGTLSSSWSAAAIGDFNGDGKSDILWSNGTAYSEWVMNGVAVSSKLDMGASASWSVVGSGDFNGDGKAEILWHNTSGATEIDGIGTSGWNNLGNPGSLDSNWSVAGIGDFDGDGKADILWRNGTAYSEWLMNGGAVASKLDMGASASWSVAGAGDYNGDGKTEVLWHNLNGSTEVDGIGPSGWVNLGTPGSIDSAWTIASQTTVLASGH